MHESTSLTQTFPNHHTRTKKKRWKGYNEIKEACLRILLMQELRALEILYDSIYDSIYNAPSASGVSAPLQDHDFPPLPQPSSIRSPRRSEFRIDLPQFLSSYLADDSQILRLMAYESPTAFFDPCERAALPSPSLATASISPQSLPSGTQFTVPLRIVPFRANSISTSSDDADAAWTLVSSTPSTPTSDAGPEAWVLLDDDS